MEKCPWYFGYTLKDLIEKADKELFSIEALELANEIFQYSVKNILSTRLLDDKIKGKIAEVFSSFKPYWHELLSLSLTISYAKPIGCIYYTGNIEILSDKISELNLYYDYEPMGGYGLDIVFTYDRYILENYREVYKKFNYLDRDLLLGILYGYPLGDILGFCRMRSKEIRPADYYQIWKRKHKYRKQLRYLLHVPTPDHWPEKWKRSIGMKGEEYLNEKYKSLIGSYESWKTKLKFI